MLPYHSTEFAHLDDNAQITVTYRVGDLRRAIELGEGGPEIMSTAQAAKIFGWTAKRWREWAEAGRVDGAWREEDGRWRLPRQGCRNRVDELQKRGNHPPKTGRSTEPLGGRGLALPAPGAPETINNPGKRSIRRGPRKAGAR